MPKFRDIMSIGFENNRKKRVDIESEIHSRQLGFVARFMQPVKCISIWNSDVTHIYQLIRSIRDHKHEVKVRVLG